MLTTALIAGVVTFIFTTLLTIAGVGAAFILIPVFAYLGVEWHVAQATALLLNSVAMVFAGYRFIKNKLVLWRVAIPLLIGLPFSSLGGWAATYVPVVYLQWLFVGFLLFAAVMMLFYQSKEKDNESSTAKLWIYGGSIGILAGFLGGLIGVGGGNFIVPVLVWLGFNPKKASATTSFVVIFFSFMGFLGHISMAHLSWTIIGITAIGSALGAVLGSWLMTDKLSRRQVKMIIGIILLLLATRRTIKLIWGGKKHNGKEDTKATKVVKPANTKKTNSPIVVPKSSDTAKPAKKD